MSVILNRKYFHYQHKACSASPGAVRGAVCLLMSDRKSGDSLMDGAEIVVLNKETGSVRQEIGQLTDGRCRNCSAKPRKQDRPTGNRAIHCGTVLK